MPEGAIIGDDIAYKSAAELTALYARRALSPVEVAQALFARLDVLQPKLNAFCVVDRDGALAAARLSERRWRTTQPLSPVDGVPATIKDLMLMRGLPTRRGSHRGFAGCRAAQGGGRGHPRQDHDPGIRLDRGGRQPADRDYPQPVEP
jgi:hypothetical protein